MAAPTDVKTLANAPANANSGVYRVQMVDSTGTVVGGTGGGAVTVADGADVTQGASADAVIAAGAAGTLSAKLRAISRDLVANIVLAAGTNTIGGVFAKATATDSGLLAVQNLDIDESEDAIKATAGQLYGYYLYNDGAAEAYVKLYNDTVANVVVGTTTAAMTLGIPAGGAANLFLPTGVRFSNAITVAATTAAATADTGAPAANQVVGTFFYV